VDDIAQLQPCHAVLTKSGTVTLELACMGIPIVVAHAVAASTHLFGRLLVRHVDHIALPNVLSRHEVVPERLGRLDSAELAVLLQAAVGAPAVSLPALGPPGATRRIADGIVSQLRQAGPSGDKRLPGAP
jgi:lipid-A-disaccharide synthase